MDEQSIEPSRAHAAQEDPIAEPPRLDGPATSATDTTQPTDAPALNQPPADAQPTTPAADASQQAATPVADAPPPSFGQPVPTVAEPGFGQSATPIADPPPPGFGQPTAPVADVPPPWQSSLAQPTPPSYAPPAGWQPNTAQPWQPPVANMPQSPWQQATPAPQPSPGWQPNAPIADLPQSQWQPNNQPTVAMQPGEPTPVASLPQSPWPQTGQMPMPPMATGQPFQQAWLQPESWHPPLLAEAGLPPGWHAPLRADLVPLKPRKRRSKRLKVIAVAVIVLLVAGVTTWLVWPPDRSPFEQAVANLAAQPVANYKSDLPDGSQWDGRTTSHGDAIGWLTADSLKFPFLIANGKLYVQLDSGLFPPGVEDTLPTGVKLTNRWVTGDLGQLAPLLKQQVTPSAIADKLRDEVARTKDLPTPSDDGTTLNNIPVLKADTPDGTLYVAKNQPYRVVRWIDKTTKKATAAFTDPGRKLQLNGARASYTGLGTTTFTPMNADDVDKTYDDMETDAGQLGNAIDTSVGLTLDSMDHNDKFDACEQAGCPVTMHFTAKPAAGASPPPQVTAEMTATVTVNDVPAGDCTTTGKIASSGAGTMTCVDKDMHAGFTTANDKAKADAEAKSGDSDYITWWLEMKTEAHAVVLASVDVGAEAKRLESFRPDHACGWSDKGGTGHVPVYLNGTFTARVDSARYPDFEIHVFQDGQSYGDFGPSGWFGKNGAAAPANPPKELTDQLAKAAVTFMKASGTLKDGDPTDGDKWKRPAPKC